MAKENSSLVMTSGGIAVPMIRFAIPLFLGSIFQQLYSTADFLFVGNALGKSAAAAVSASGILVTCLIGMFTGLSTGAGVTIAHCVGARDRKGAQDHMDAAIFLAFFGGILLMLMGELLAVPALHLLNTPEQLMPEAVAYIRLYFIGMLPMILYNIGSGILRACGDSKSPFHILIIGGILNVCADALLILVLGAGVRGAALATTISQGVSALLVLWKLHRGNEILRLTVLKHRVSRNCIARIVRVGVPAGLQSMVITLSNILVQYHINGYGEDVIAAFATYFKLENFTYFPVLAFGQAAMTFVGQNAGAGRYDRVKKGLRIAMLMSMGMVAGIAFVLLLFGATSVGWFLKEPQVIRIGVQIISITFPVYWLNSMIEVLGGGIRGMGYSTVSMIVILCTLCLFRTALLTVLDLRIHTVQGVALVYPLSWSAAVLCLFLSYRILLKRKMESAKVQMED